MRRASFLQLTQFLAIALLLAIPCISEMSMAELSQDNNYRIVFLGDSLTVGYGLNPEQAYPSLIQKRLEHEGYPHKVINAGVSGETTAAGLRRLNWILREPMSLLVICLGANDGLRGVDPKETYRNLKQMIQITQKKDLTTKIALCEMRAPTSMGEKYTSQFHATFTKVANEMHVNLITFFLRGVAGEPTLNQADGIHPTAEGQKILAENMWKEINVLLQTK